MTKKEVISEIKSIDEEMRELGIDISMSDGLGNATRISKLSSRLYELALQVKNVDFLSDGSTGITQR